MKYWRIFSGAAFFSSILLLFLGYDIASALWKLCALEPVGGTLMDAHGLGHSAGCFTADELGGFNWKRWLLTQAIASVILGIALSLTAIGLYRASLLARRFWLLELVLVVLYFALFWVFPGGTFSALGICISASYSAVFAASVRFLPKIKGGDATP